MGLNFFQKNKRIILAVILVGLIAAPLALVPVHQAKALSWFGVAEAFGTSAVQGILDALANSALLLAGLITAFAGTLFNLAVGFSLHLADFLKTTPFIDTAWKTFRDLANMFFIFILLYTAIKTILGDNPGKILASIIITALLVNFSMFFTKVAIDASNILTLNFYNAINIPPKSTFNILDSKTWGLGLSDPFMHALAIQTTYPKDADLANPTYQKLFAAAGAAITQRILSQSVGVIIMLIAAFVFFAGAWMFIARTVILLFLLMFSPIAVVSRLTPKSKTIWDKWSGALIKQLIFAPAFMIMIWVVLNILKADAIKNLMSGGFGGALGGDVNAFGVLFGYGFVIAMLIMVLIVSQSVGATGSTLMIKWGQSLRKGAQGWAGRNTLGRAGAALDKKWEEKPFGRTALGSTLRGWTTGALAKSKYGGKESLEDSKEARGKRINSYITKNISRDPAAVASYIQRELRGKDQEEAYKRLSARDRAAIEPHLNPAVAAGFRSKLSIEEREKTEDSIRTVGIEQRARENRNDLERIATGTPNPATGAPYTFTQISNAVNQLAPSQTRRLSNTARKYPGIIQKLTARHLEDLQKNGDLQPDEIAAIRAEVFGATMYPNQPAQQNYINANLALWS